MKYIKTFEHYDDGLKKVYWICKFGKDFEDSLVKLVIQYKGNEDEYEGIENIDYALGIANSSRFDIPEDEKYVIITMSFKIENEITVYGPEFGVYNIDDKEHLEREKYLFIGFAPNTDKEEYKIYLDSNKYNI